MSDPEDSRDELARRSRADKATITTLTLQDLPSELILRIVSFLEIKGLLALRRTHRSIYSLSQDKLLWRGLLRDLRPPLPRTLRSRPLGSLSYPELEKAVLDSCMVEHQWLKRREHSLTLYAIFEHSWTRLLDFLDDRWVIHIPTLGLPTIWDTRENPPKLLELPSRYFLDGSWDATTAVDPRQGDIIIGLQNGQSASQVLRVHPTETGSDSLRLTDYGVTHHPNPNILCLEPSRNMVIIGPSSIGIEIGDWTRSRSVVIGMTGANYNHVIEPILGLRLVGDYILSFRTRWIELLYVPPFPNASELLVAGRDPASHPFHLKCGEIAFQSASLSEPQPNPESLDDSRIIYILAYQAKIGLLYFRITIHNPDYSPSVPRARMDVDLVGVYELDKLQAGIGGIDGPRIAFGISLGPEGKRGTWIERLSGLKEFVVAASFDQSSLACVPVGSGDDLQELCQNAPRIESVSNVFEFNRDFNYDIVRCAFSESTGKIVLRTRDKRIILL